jgi:threonine dehydrogenase-like Zn-dependent dehydrogenase
MKKEKRLLRVGVLGCGPISQAAHLEASLKARNAELYAVCDLAEDLVQKIAARFEPRKTFTDYDAMLADPKVEAVVVAIADQFHVDAAIRALKAGKHVLVEKLPHRVRVHARPGRPAEDPRFSMIRHEKPAGRAMSTKVSAMMVIGDQRVPVSR